TQPAANDSLPPPQAAGAREPLPAPPTVAAAGDARRRVLAALLASAAGLGILAAFALAWINPLLSPAVAAVVLFVSAIALWGAARVDHRRLRFDLERLAGENHRLTARLESLADTAWELRESEERYRSLVDAQGDLVVRRDAVDRVTFVNPAFTAAFGRSSAALIGAALTIIPPVAPGSASGGERAAARDVKLMTARGTRWYSWVDIRMRDEVYSVARDITERKDVEQALLDARHRAEAASQAKSRVLATVSHEFRTPLNGILGLTGLLAETELTPDQATYVRAVHSSGEALLALVDDMLDFSKIEAGRLDLRPEPTDLEALLQDIAELIAGRAHLKGIDLAVAIGRDVPAVVIVDPARLRQVLINLAGNGIKFTDEGGVTLSVGRAADGIVFAVSDSGPGIPPGDAERLFDEFEQMDAALGRRHGGAGLGLAISRRIVRRMGGDLTVSGREGGGSVFSLTLDLPVAEGALSARPTADLRGRSVLVLSAAGPEPDALARHLADAGAHVRIARTLSEAAGLIGAATAAGEGHDAVLVDARTAQDARTALATIREAAGRPVPVAVLIEPGRRGEVEGLRAAGFDAYLVRPVRRSSLIRVVADNSAGGGGNRGFRIDPGDASPPKPRRGEPRGAARRGQRDQRAARPRRAGGSRPYRHGGPRRRLGGGGRQGAAADLRRDPHGPAHARSRRPRGGKGDSRVRGRGRAVAGGDPRRHRRCPHRDPRRRESRRDRRGPCQADDARRAPPRPCRPADHLTD
ncbi:MAG: ATP-binding protein, partial [Bauldia sp.]|nr:ATP-binding protein [Bauldia sp.]